MSTIRHLGLVPTLALASACSAANPSAEAVASRGESIVVPSDPREDMYQLAGQNAILNNADGVAVMVYSSYLEVSGGTVTVPTETFQQGYNVCGGQPYDNQPVIDGGWCTGYLVSPTLVATAGHCVDWASAGTNESQFSFVFGYRMLNATTAETTFSTADVYTGVQVAALCSNADCALVQLSRPVTNHRILQLSQTAPTLSDSVYVLGYPFVLPLKYDEPAPLFRVVDNTFFAQLSIGGGNSGSPVFNATTNLVEGTLAGYSSSAAPEFDSTDAGCSVEHVEQPQDNFEAYAFTASNFDGLVEPYCSGDTGGWQACGTSGCGICPQAIHTSVYNLYFQNHPSCTLAASCTGALTACSAACPAPTAADSSGGASDGGLTSCIPQGVTGSVITEHGSTSVPGPSFTYAAPSASDTLLVVHFDDGSGGTPPTAVTYGGAPLTRLKTTPDANSGEQQIWYLVGPAAGAHTLTFTTSGANVPYDVEVETLEGVNPSLPFGAVSTGYNATYSTHYTTSLTTLHTNGLMADFISYGSGDDPTVALGSGQTESYDLVATPTDAISSVLPAYAPTTYSQSYTFQWADVYSSISAEIVSWCE